VKCTTGPKDQQCTDLSPLSLWLALRSLDEGGLALRSLDEGGLALRSLDEGGTGEDTCPTESQSPLLNRQGAENPRGNGQVSVLPPSVLGLIRGETAGALDTLKGALRTVRIAGSVFKEYVVRPSGRLSEGSFRLISATQPGMEAELRHDVATMRGDCRYADIHLGGQFFRR
jgi:hypothetical protein